MVDYVINFCVRNICFRWFFTFTRFNYWNEWKQFFLLCIYLILFSYIFVFIRPITALLSIEWWTYVRIMVRSCVCVFCDPFSLPFFLSLSSFLFLFFFSILSFSVISIPLGNSIFNLQFSIFLFFSSPFFSWLPHFQIQIRFYFYLI